MVKVYKIILIIKLKKISKQMTIWNQINAMVLNKRKEK